MAVPFVENYNGDGSNRIFTVISPILSESHVRVDFYYEDVIGEGYTDHHITSGNWDIINNSVVFRVPPAAGYIVKISVSSDGEGLDTAPSDVTNVAASLNMIVELANNMEHIEKVYSVSDALEALYTDKDELDAVHAALAQIEFNYNNIDIIAGAEDNAHEAQLRAWEAKANEMSANSFANEDHNVNVKTYTSNGDGTFSHCDCSFYSAKHWQVEAFNAVGQELIDAVANNTAQIALNTEAVNNLASSQGEVEGTQTSGYVLDRIPDVFTEVPIDTIVPSTDDEVFEIDESSNTITFKKNASYSLNQTLTLESHTNGERTINFRIVDVSDDTTVYTREAIVETTSGDITIFSMLGLLTIGKNGFPNAPVTLRLEVKEDTEKYSLKKFNSVITSSADYDIQTNIEHAAIIGGIIDIEQGEAIGIIDTMREYPKTSRVGELVMMTGLTPFNDCLKADGTLYKRADAPKLWEYAQTSGNLVTDEEWHINRKVAYSDGDGSTTFRVPDYRGEFIRGFDDGAGVDANRPFGSLQMDMIKEHKHPELSLSWRAIFKSDTDRYGWYRNNNGYTKPAQTSFGGKETRPRNGTVMYCIKYI